MDVHSKLVKVFAGGFNRVVHPKDADGRGGAIAASKVGERACGRGARKWHRQPRIVASHVSPYY